MEISTERSSNFPYTNTLNAQFARTMGRYTTVKTEFCHHAWQVYWRKQKRSLNEYLGRMLDICSIRWIFPRTFNVIIFSKIYDIQRSIHNSVKHLRWSFWQKKFTIQKVRLQPFTIFAKKLHLECLAGFWIRLH